MSKLTHFDDQGKSRMVDVGSKPVSSRMAIASGRISMSAACFDLVQKGTHSKGNVLEVARLAGIMASKRTADLIPLCHPLGIDSVAVDFEMLPPHEVRVTARIEMEGKTGVEMEALTSVTVALLTIYDMCKAVDRTMEIGDVRLEEKRGGKSGHFVRGKE